MRGGGVVRRMRLSPVTLWQSQSADHVDGRIIPRPRRKIEGLRMGIQPAAPHELERVDVGDLISQGITVFDYNLILIPGSVELFVDADILEYEGRMWRVVKCTPWDAEGFRHAIALRMPPELAQRVA